MNFVSWASSLVYIKNQLNGTYWCCFKLKCLSSQFIFYFSFICCKTFAPPALCSDQRRKHQRKSHFSYIAEPMQKRGVKKITQGNLSTGDFQLIWGFVDAQNTSQSLSGEDLAFLNQRETQNCLAFRNQLQLFPLGTTYSPSPSVILMAFVPL